MHLHRSVDIGRRLGPKVSHTLIDLMIGLVALTSIAGVAGVAPAAAHDFSDARTEHSYASIPWLETTWLEEMHAGNEGCDEIVIAGERFCIVSSLDREMRSAPDLAPADDSNQPLTTHTWIGDAHFVDDSSPSSSFTFCKDQAGPELCRQVTFADSGEKMVGGK
jgi:hypothetical protein